MGEPAVERATTDSFEELTGPEVLPANRDKVLAEEGGGLKNTTATPRTFTLEERLAELTTQAVEDCLKEKFVNCEEIARALTRALRTGKNLILWGPPGHGKSMMVAHVFKELGLKQDAFVLDFGEGMEGAIFIRLESSESEISNLINPP